MSTYIAVPSQEVAEVLLTEACAVAERDGDCRRRKVGALVVQGGHVLASGANGVRPGRLGCLAGLCPRGRLSYEELAGHVPSYSDPDSPGYCISMHAEIRATLAALRHTARLDLCFMFATARPCAECHKFLLNAGFHGYFFPGEDGNPQYVGLA